MTTDVELLIVGAGPAGMAAAEVASKFDIETVVVDEQKNPGGQIYRQVDKSPLNDPSILGSDYQFGHSLVQRFRYCGVDYRPQTSVWYVDNEKQAGLLHRGIQSSVTSTYKIFATGAQERPMPFAGWQKPGVLMAGAGQVLMKSAAMVPDDGVVLAGSGPLLWLIGWQYLKAGVEIKAVLDTSKKTDFYSSLKHAPEALPALDYLIKGLSLKLAIRRARIPVFKSVTHLDALGNEVLESIQFVSQGVKHSLDCSLLLIHQGVIPEVHMAQAAGCDIEWNDVAQSWRPVTDTHGSSSRGDIFFAGDNAGIGGARAAAISGQISSLSIANKLGRLDDGQFQKRVQSLIKSRQRHFAIRPLLDSMFRVSSEWLNPVDETIVCRCESITAGQIREVINLGCVGPNQAKSFLRCGMGPCQGRQCANTVEQIFASELSESVSNIGRYSVRSPLKPITLGSLAAGIDERVNEV